MGHGIGGIKAAGLTPFATTFTAHGYVAVTFDYLYFGDSEGEPRNMMEISQELQDFRDVVAWARLQPERFDVDRIVVWGTSFGGMHVTALLAEDHQLAAGILQCPCVDGLSAVLQTPFPQSLWLILTAVQDYTKSLFGGDPVYVRLAGDGMPESPLAIMTGDEVMRGWKRLDPTENVPFPNKITARSLLGFPFHRPIQHIHRSVKPFLVVLPAWDGQVPLHAAEEVVRLAPLGEGLQVQGGHFDLYFGGPAFEENVAGQLGFLNRVLGSN
ncbi:putative alpha/beta fold family hydrolase [Dactylonectria estremocensis]|uniref:Alpha/beta fold family hydrolase n=1 Tax=Dactylonectria estremocensis TaxID=1079267 RepID=A0A9P9IRG6_9HYPO|nr:putative alpha/beta fold family hydrolase [Dactylonectria estremocensis]